MSYHPLVKKKSQGLVFYILLALSIVGCSDTEDSGPPYTKDWVLNLSEYLGTDYSEIDSYLLSDYGLTQLDDETVLVHEYSKSGRHLIEVDAVNGLFLHQSGVDFALRDSRKRMDGSVLLTGYGAAGSYVLGTYNDATHFISPLATLDAAEISDPSNERAIHPGDDVLYTHNPNISPNGDEVYIAKWNFDGTQIWRKNIDPSNKKKVGKMSSIQKEHVLFVSVEDADLDTEHWNVGKISKDGEVLWHKQLNEYGYIFDLLENDAGDFFVLNGRGASKVDTKGNVIWTNPLSEYDGKFMWGNGVTTSDGGVLFQLQSNNKEEWLIKINSAGEVTWEEEYWEDRPDKLISLSFLELPSADLIVYSTTGYITLYRKN